jgi:hypothetical protein
LKECRGLAFNLGAKFEDGESVHIIVFPHVFLLVHLK